MNSIGQHIGAVLYVPANHPDLSLILRGEKLAQVKTLIICLEDAIAAHEYPQAVLNLKKALTNYSPARGKQCFLRPRNLDCFYDIMHYQNARECFIGAVLPKFDHHSFTLWSQGLSRLPMSASFALMPTLETAEVFNAGKMRNLADMLSDSILTAHISTLRIGGNDLLSLLNMRRSRGKTIYETLLGVVIANLATTFIPCGFDLSAPVYEYFTDSDTLKREIAQDLAHGLTGKTAIHPQQVIDIEQQYKVSRQVFEEAQAILQPDACGVFRMNDAMCEPETHSNWAKKVLMRADTFGIV